VRTHDPPQFVRPAAQVHAPAVHVVPGPHTVPQAPQFFGSAAVDVHTPAHEVSPAGQEHTPRRQVVPALHTVPHAPQLFGSVEVVVQRAPQSV